MAESVAIYIKPFGMLTPKELLEAVRLRQEVFYLEQHVDCQDCDRVDEVSVFMWAECEGRMVGFLRMIPPGAVYAEASIGRVAVLKEWRRRGIARRMVAVALEHIGREWGGDVRISSQEYIVPLYEQLGFRTVSEPYAEAGIPHRKMLKKGVPQSECGAEENEKF